MGVGLAVSFTGRERSFPDRFSKKVFGSGCFPDSSRGVIEDQGAAITEGDRGEDFLQRLPAYATGVTTGREGVAPSRVVPGKSTCPIHLGTDSHSAASAMAPGSLIR
jgi:hypothetical protein